MGVATTALLLPFRAAQLTVAAVLIFFVAWQGTMLAKETRYIKTVPEWISKGPHCTYVTEQGWNTKYPQLGCHAKKGFTVKDLVKVVPALKWTPTDLARMAEKNSPYTVQDLLAVFTDRASLA